MHLTSKFLITTILLFSSSQATAYICFESTEYKDQKICYTRDPEKDLVAKKYFIEFTEKLSNPGNLVTLHGEMENLYTPEKFHSSLIKHYSHVTPESIEQIMSHGDISAVFLKSGEMMYFNHVLSSFIFDFESPLIFVGAHKFYHEGAKPKVQKSPLNKSNCNLQKEGVIFLSPKKESFFYNKTSTFCTYANFFLDKVDNKITAKPVNSIGKGQYSISGSMIEFANFIKWLQEP